MMHLSKLNVLYLVDAEEDIEIILNRLEVDCACPVIMDTADTHIEMVKMIKCNTYDVILADFSFSGYNTMASLKQVLSTCPAVPFICISGPIGEDTAVELLKQGAADFVFKNRLGRLSFAIERAISMAKEKISRARIEASLRESQRLAHVGNWDSDLINDETYWSDELYQLLGYEPQTIVPNLELFLERIPSQERDQVNNQILDSVNEKKTFLFEHSIIRMDGSIRTARTRGYALYNQKDEPIRLIGITQDITKQKEVEQELLRAKENMEDAQCISHVGSWEWSINEQKRFWSDEFYRIFGLEPQSIDTDHKLLYQYIHADDIHNIIKLMTSFMTERKSFEIEFRIVRGEGRICHVKMKGQLHFDQTGKITRMLGTLQDITERKAAEEEARCNIELRELSRKNKLITDFFTNMSHEFKTPLSVILMQLELMKLYFDDEAKMQELIAATTQNSYRLSRLVGNILDISKLDAGFMEARFVRTDMVSLIRDICQSVNDYIKSKSIQFKFKASIKKKIMPIDIEKTERIMLNLLSNAIKHTSRDGIIEVCIKNRKKGGVILSVEDTGVGIPKDKLKIIFDRFAQVDTSYGRQNEGTGIGLALVKSLVEIVRGEITVSSELGKGSKFKIELPINEMKSESNAIELQGFNLAKKVEMEFSDIYLKA